MMGISRASYYYNPKDSSKKYSDFQVREMIENIHTEFPFYGYRRIYQSLLRQDIRINSKRLKRVMREFELYSSLKRFMRPRGTHSSVQLRYENKIKGLKLDGPNQVWATDITYIKLKENFVYLSAVIDIYTRKIVGWSISDSLTHEFCIESMKSAIEKEKPPHGVIHHSDRGVQYVCEPYVKYLLDNGFVPSMSRPATPQDNAFIESFFKTLKKEEVYFKKYKSLSDVLKSLPKFIEEVYNKKRLHSSLGYKSPEEFEAIVLKIKPADRPVQKVWGKAV
jgi:putative transposase